MKIDKILTEEARTAIEKRIARDECIVDIADEMIKALKEMEAEDDADKKSIERSIQLYEMVFYEKSSKIKRLKAMLEK